MTKSETTLERVGGYRVVRRLATGGTSDVLLAKAEGPHGFERTVVLKLLLSQFRNDDEFAKMFAREASAYARLSHPAIVQLFDFFAVPEAPQGAPPKQGGRGGQLCMVLEHVDGPPLTRLRTMLKAVGNELDDRAAMFVASRVFDALAAAHGTLDESGAVAPVIHRDVNPSNVLVPWDGQVKLADFGVAKVTGLEHQSVAGMIKGTYGYMAPEQVTGEPVTPRADVYAASIILWELLTKRRAFQRGALPEIEALRAMAEPRLPSLDTLRPDLDRAVRDALKRALEPHADRRTISAEEMAAVLVGAVPVEEGRERLVRTLAIVRNSSQAAMGGTSALAAATPSTAGDPKTIQAAVAPPATLLGAPAPAPAPPASSSGRGMLPKPASPPRPPSVPRMKPPEPPRAPSRSTLQSTMRSPAGPPPLPSTASQPRLPAAGAAPAHDAPRRPSASSRLAVAVPEARPTTTAASHASGEMVPRVDPPEPPPPQPSPRRLGTLIEEALPQGLGLKEAIDEILREQPSSMPPSVLESVRPTVSDGDTRTDADEDGADAGTLVMETSNVSRELGQIPPAPPPMRAMQTTPLHATPPVDFSATVREMADRAEAPTVAPPSGIAPPTPRMGPAPPLASMTTPDGPRLDGPPAPLLSTGTASTGRMPQYVPPAAYRTPAPGPSAGAASVPAIPGAGHLPSDLRRSLAEELEPRPRPEKRARASAGAIVAVLLFGLLAGVAGVFVYVRHQASGDAGASTNAGRPAASAPAGSASAQASAAALASAGPAASVAAPAGSASAPAGSASAPAGSAAAQASAAASTSDVAGIPEGMGVVKTTGAAPGRRIFVDEKTLGQTPESVTVKCGPHSVRLGSSGKPQTIDVPCGGDVTVGDKF